MGSIAVAIRGIHLPEQNKRKLLSLDQEFVEMEAEIQTLKSENLLLQAKVNPLEREIERLKSQIKKNALPQADHHSKRRPIEEEEILAMLLRGPMEERAVICTPTRL